MTPWRVLTTQQADTDINTAIGHYPHQGAAEAAMNLIDALEESKVLLSEHPDLGSTRFAMETRIPELRSLSLPRFPYLVFYTAQGATIRISVYFRLPGISPSDSQKMNSRRTPAPT